MIGQYDIGDQSGQGGDRDSTLLARQRRGDYSPSPGVEEHETISRREPSGKIETEFPAVSSTSLHRTPGGSARNLAGTPVAEDVISAHAAGAGLAAGVRRTSPGRHLLMEENTKPIIKVVSSDGLRCATIPFLPQYMT